MEVMVVLEVTEKTEAMVEKVDMVV